MWIGACTSSIGTWMQIVAQGWLIYRLSHSAFLLALDQFLGGIPIFLFSLLGGVVADRVERRKIPPRLAVCADDDRRPAHYSRRDGHVHVWHILCLSFISGFAQAFGGPAYQALIPTLVEKEDMPNAIALNSIQFNVAVMVGPALAGQALAKLGEKWCFGLNALSFLAPIISLSLITARFLPVKTTDSVLSSLKQGIRFTRKQSSMEALIILAFCMTGLSMPMRTYFPVFVKDIFHRGPETYGNLLALMGLGSICGSLGIASAGNFRKKRTRRARRADLPGRGHFRLRLIKVPAAEREFPGAGRRIHDGGFRHRKFSCPIDHDQRNARPRNERLQLRLPRRHAHGQSALRMARPAFYRSGSIKRQWIRPDSARSVLSVNSTESWQRSNIR